MAADGVDLTFYASRAFLRDWKRAFPTMKDCAVSKVDLLRRRAASSVDWLHHYDTVELPERLGRCIEIEIGRADRLIARVDGSDVKFVGVGGRDITERIKHRLTGRAWADAIDPPLELTEGPAWASPALMDTSVRAIMSPGTRRHGHDARDAASPRSSRHTRLN